MRTIEASEFKTRCLQTPGNHGNLGAHDVDPGDDVPIPPALGEFSTVLTPMPVDGMPDKNVSGVIGCIAILLEEDETPAHAVALLPRRLIDQGETLPFIAGCIEAPHVELEHQRAFLLYLSGNAHALCLEQSSDKSGVVADEQRIRAVVGRAGSGKRICSAISTPLAPFSPLSLTGDERSFAPRARLGPAPQPRS